MNKSVYNVIQIEYNLKIDRMKIPGGDFASV